MTAYNATDQAIYADINNWLISPEHSPMILHVQEYYEKCKSAGGTVVQANSDFIVSEQGLLMRRLTSDDSTQTLVPVSLHLQIL